MKGGKFSMDVLNTLTDIETDIETAIAQHRNQKFSPDAVINAFMREMQAVAQLCTGLDMSISDQDIRDLVTAKENVNRLIEDRFSKLISMSRERQSNLLRYHHINLLSLGMDCLSRTIPTRWGLKKTARLGEKSSPFDLAVHSPFSVERLINANFDGYLDTEHLVFLEQHNICSNKKYHVNFNHEIGLDYAANDFKKLCAIYEQRIANFQATLNNPSPLCLVVHLPHFQGAGDPAQIDSLRRVLALICSQRHYAPTIMVCVNSFLPDNKPGIEEVKEETFTVWNIALPRVDYVWFQPECFLTDDGYAYEKHIVELIRKQLDTIR